MGGLHDFLDESAARFPHKPAFIGQRITTYSELDHSTRRFAAALQGLGVQKGDRVALTLDGTVDYLIAFYGTVRAGAVAVPLCPDTRSKTLMTALTHSGAKVLVTAAGVLRYVAGAAELPPSLEALIVSGPAPNEPVHGLELRAFDEFCRGVEQCRDAGTSAEDLAALVYTSGTTGAPKGVMLPHRALIANTRSIVRYLELGPDDVAGMVLPFYYVFGNSVLHTHIAAGATIAHLGSMGFAAQVLQRMAEHRCTGFYGVPATYAALCAVKDFSAFDLRALRYLAVAGAAMPRTQVATLRALLPEARLILMYGQTEAAARLAYVPPELLDQKLGSAGRAIPGVVLKVVDERGQPLAPGEVGEVVAQGDNVMLGYWQDPEASARALRPEGLHTGDIGYMDADGFLFLLGRGSDMIKSGGHRISPAEVEEAVLATPGVCECGVVGVPDPMLGEAIAAFVVESEPGSTTRQNVLASCFQLLPGFKLPKQLRVVEELPKNNVGKLQRYVLREWFSAGRGRVLE